MSGRQDEALRFAAVADRGFFARAGVARRSAGPKIATAFQNRFMILSVVV